MHVAFYDGENKKFILDVAEKSKNFRHVELRGKLLFSTFQNRACDVHSSVQAKLQRM